MHDETDFLEDTSFGPAGLPLDGFEALDELAGDDSEEAFELDSFGEDDSSEDSLEFDEGAGEEDFEQGLFEAGDDETIELESDFESAPFQDLELDYQIIGADTRRRIRNTRLQPWRYICRLQLGATGGGVCTGTLVGPNKVLTAAHCVKSGSTVQRQVRVIPGKNGSGTSRGSEPFGAALGRKIELPARFRHAADPFDYAVITLDRPLGRTVGWWRNLRAIPSAQLLRFRLNTAGYPNDKGGNHLYWTRNQVVRAAGAKLEYLHDTFGGQSGSPLWVRYQSNRALVAIHAAADDPRRPGIANQGVALTPGILADIRRWLRS